MKLSGDVLVYILYELIAVLFVEQPLALPGSHKKVTFWFNIN